ncbi:MAG: hypothetical protein ACLPM3_10975 [Terracidiphilus sp.]
MASCAGFSEPFSHLDDVEASESRSGKKSLYATERDTTEIRRRREEFLERIGSTSLEKLIFLDESGVTVGLMRLYARARCGVLVYEATPQSHWKIPTILGAISMRSMVAAMTVPEATDREIFSSVWIMFCDPGFASAMWR